MTISVKTANMRNSPNSPESNKATSMTRQEKRSPFGSGAYGKSDEHVKFSGNQQSISKSKAGDMANMTNSPNLPASNKATSKQNRRSFESGEYGNCVEYGRYHKFAKLAVKQQGNITIKAIRASLEAVNMLNMVVCKSGKPGLPQNRL